MMNMPLVARFALDARAFSEAVTLLYLRRAPDTGEVALSAVDTKGRSAAMPAGASLPPAFAVDEAEAVTLVADWLASTHWRTLAVDRPRQPPQPAADGQTAGAGAGVADQPGKPLADATAAVPSAGVAVAAALAQAVADLDRLAAPSTDADSYPEEMKPTDKTYGGGFRDGHASAQNQVRDMLLDLAERLHKAPTEADWLVKWAARNEAYDMVAQAAADFSLRSPDVSRSAMTGFASFREQINRALAELRHR